MWICGKNIWKIYVKKFSFCKFSGFQHVTWLKMNYFANIVQGFWSYIPEHLSFQTSLTSCFRFAYISLPINSDFTISVIHYAYFKTTSKIIPLNHHKFQILNQDKEARGKLGGEYAYEQQSKSILPCFNSSMLQKIYDEFKHSQEKVWRRKNINT